jgi:predicted nucleotidyltransferase
MTIFDEKRKNSEEKLSELKRILAGSPELRPFCDLTIFATGSYARGEASTHSDIDLFFLNKHPLSSDSDNNINSITLFAKIIDIAKQLNLPKFSNDGAYLKIMEGPHILEHLGNSSDDYMNHFTARLLMILESKPVFGEDSYNAILKDVLGRYFEDYPDHPENFHPTFLINDIVRFWKTLCLNYENKRNQPVTDEEKKISQKIKNFKLKFSRMLTCFGSICYISAQRDVLGPNNLIQMTSLNPIERLQKSTAGLDLSRAMDEAYVQYEWFLNRTNVSESDLKLWFSDKDNRIEAFEKAELFGDAIFEITKTVSTKTGYLRYLVV